MLRNISTCLVLFAVLAQVLWVEAAHATLVAVSGNAQTLSPAPPTPPLQAIVAARYSSIKSYGISPDGTIAVVYAVKNAKRTVEIINTISGAWLWQIDPQHYSWKGDTVSLAIDNAGVVTGLFYSPVEDVSRWHKMEWDSQRRRVIHSQFGHDHGKMVFFRCESGEHTLLSESWLKKPVANK